MFEWKPIATVPEDTVVDVWAFGERYPNCSRKNGAWTQAHSRDLFDETDRLGGGLKIRTFTDTFQPTHWLQIQPPE